MPKREFSEGDLHSLLTSPLRPVLWLGAGAGKQADPPLPTLAELAARLRSEFSWVPSPGCSDYGVFSEFLRDRTKAELAQFLEGAIRPGGISSRPGHLHRVLADMIKEGMFAGVIDTNYDLLLKSALVEARASFVHHTRRDNIDIAGTELRYVSIHGSMDNWDEIVLTPESYSEAELSDGDRLLRAQIDLMLVRHPVLFIGCSMTDPRITQWIQGLDASGGSHLKSWVAIMRADGYDYMRKRYKGDKQCSAIMNHISVHIIRSHDDLIPLLERIRSGRDDAPPPPPPPPRPIVWGLLAVSMAFAVILYGVSLLKSTAKAGQRPVASVRILSMDTLSPIGERTVWIKVDVPVQGIALEGVACNFDNKQGAYYASLVGPGRAGVWKIPYSLTFADESPLSGEVEAKLSYCPKGYRRLDNEFGDGGYALTIGDPLSGIRFRLIPASGLIASAGYYHGRKAIYIATNEVTIGQWRHFIDANPNFLTQAERVGQSLTLVPLPSDQGRGGQWSKVECNWRDPLPQQRVDPSDDWPVVHVSAEDAQGFCDWANADGKAPMQLPPEGVWEYACRAGSTSKFFWGDDVVESVHYANISDQSLLPFWIKSEKPPSHLDGFPFFSPVGKLNPNAFGLHDMIGNAWEWCVTEVDGQVAARGGSWASDYDTATCDKRNLHPMTITSGVIGFRLCVLL